MRKDNMAILAFFRENGDHYTTCPPNNSNDSTKKAMLGASHRHKKAQT
ncbi:hypothetical protein LU276_00025 [Moraxella haemolytica]|nr:hypothetical protein [Moraxella sp. ZY171148]WII95296.1 hypothetical protein LU276_00025 [Moraxella sp. ZY171148]